MVAHDDDFLLIPDPDHLLCKLNKLASSEVSALYAKPYYIDTNLSIKPASISPTFYPIYQKLRPFRLPPFPSWIYRFNDRFKTIYFNTIHFRKAGKYSDIILIENILNGESTAGDSHNLCVDEISYYYREHDTNDSSTIDLLGLVSLYYILGCQFKTRIFIYLILQQSISFVKSKIFLIS